MKNRTNSRRVRVGVATESVWDLCACLRRQCRGKCAYDAASLRQRIAYVRDLRSRDTSGVRGG
eukprot:908311-Rhodomonas_salina.1